MVKGGGAALVHVLIKRSTFSIFPLMPACDCFIVCFASRQFNHGIYGLQVDLGIYTELLAAGDENRVVVSTYYQQLVK